MIGGWVAYVPLLVRPELLSTGGVSSRRYEVLSLSGIFIPLQHPIRSHTARYIRNYQLKQQSESQSPHSVTTHAFSAF